MRLLRHLLALPGAVARAFPRESLEKIASAVREAENRHGGEVRFAVEAALDPLSVLKGQAARERAVEVFSDLRVWDTERNNGVLLYLLLADRDVEIVADRGFNGRVEAREWEAVCRVMEAALKEGRYEAAVLAGIAQLSALMARCYPSPDDNELPDVAVRHR